MFDTENLEMAEGTVERVIYQNADNGYSVAELSVGEAEFLTIVGILPCITEGETIKAYGTFTVHPQFGRQFKVEYYEKELPSTEGTILKYLSSNSIKGVGKAVARKIVDQFGTEAFDVIENHPEWLTDIKGISSSKAEQISEDFKRQHGMRSVMAFCSDYFPPSTAVRIFKRFGGSAVGVIKQNPYVLSDEIYGIGFSDCDRIAKDLGMKKDCLERVEAALKYILLHNANQNGHTFIPEEKLLGAGVQVLNMDKEPLSDILDELISAGTVCKKRVGDRKCVYLRKFYDAEKYVCEKLKLLEEKNISYGINDINRTIDNIELTEGIKYAPRQREAISLAVNSGVMVLTGGPGTGKTTVIKAAINIFGKMGYKIALAAPTGRAAKRMSEATSCEAKTIHRLLEMEYNDGLEPKFIRCEKNLLDENVIIIDEASMIDISLADALLKAIKPGAKLILIGDFDQLPSVGAGNVLKDIISSERFNTVQLTEIFRQAEQSLIVTNAHAINSGKYPDLTTKSNDFFFMARENDEATAYTVAQLCKTRLPKAYGADIVRQIQVITPSRKGNAGTEILNEKLQAVLNPPSSDKKEKKLRHVVFREGDKVMQIKNNYNIEWYKDDHEGIGIFNGDIGTIIEINPSGEYVTINFDDRIARYDFTMMDEVEHGYAITVHKSQGSEYPVVIIPIYSYSNRLLTRNLLYTAVTRAQKMVILVGDETVVKKMVDNNQRAMRYTSLGEMLSVYD